VDVSEFAEKVIVITGGGSGIGRGTALLFARERSRVAVIDWNESAGSEVKSLIQEAGGQGLFIKADVSQSVQVQQAFSEIVERFGTIDILFSNAAVQVNSPLMEATEEEWDQMNSVNLKGAFLCCKCAIPVMQQQRRGCIVISSSGHAFHTYPGYTAYAATKGGLLAFVRAAALDAAPYGIRVNCLIPGATDTPLLRYHLRNCPDDEARIKAKIPLGRFGRPEDVAKAVRFLASDDAAYITGTWLAVDGGLLASG
jgi:NAD(P)-dependent dehydrogenase (short-subunit alcohol dehydrogenase family)